MKFRRRKESHPWIKLTAKSLFMGCAVVVVIVYLVSFAAVIGTERQTKLEKEFHSALRSAHDAIQGLEIREGEDHAIHDKLAVKQLGGSQQEHEIAPKAVEDNVNDQEKPKMNTNTNTNTNKHKHDKNDNYNNNNNNGQPLPITIGYAVTITGCGKEPITEGAAVLKHSIHLASVHGNLNGIYDYQMYAIHHPSAVKCAKTLESLGYELVERETPVAVEDIQGEYLKSRIEKNGCCGEKELIKLEAYTLTQHPIVVHLDLDTLILQPLDNLFDWMLLGVKARTFDNNNNNNNKDNNNKDSQGFVELQWPEDETPETINAFFTRDYNMGGAKKKRLKPVQGGFLVLRPDRNVYKEFVEIIRRGDFREGSGWGGKTGVFYGSMTFQGIIPYYYDVLHPGTALEVNHCAYNQMADNPRDQRTVNDVVHGKCMTGAEECEDCRSRPLEEVITAHFTLCQKPWWCLPQDSNIIQQRLCRKLHHEWYRIRSELETSWGRSGVGEGGYQKDHFFGYCKKHSQPGYLYIREPFGVP